MGITCEGLVFMTYSTSNIDRGIPARGLQRSMFLPAVPLCTPYHAPGPDGRQDSIIRRRQIHFIEEAIRKTYQPMKEASSPIGFS